MLAPYFKKALHGAQDNWRKVVSLAVLNGVSTPAFSSALAYFDGYRAAVLPANLLQAQRDFFGAHTYERTDQPRGKFFHVDWPEAGRPQYPIDDDGNYIKTTDAKGGVEGAGAKPTTKK